jgi:hypothetical protein
LLPIVGVLHIRSNAEKKLQAKKVVKERIVKERKSNGRLGMPLQEVDFRASTAASYSVLLYTTRNNNEVTTDY